MFRNGIKSLISNNSIIDRDIALHGGVSEETLESAKEKLEELMTKIKSISSGVALSELKKKIEFQLHKIMLIEKYLVIKIKRQSEIADIEDYKYHCMHDQDAEAGDVNNMDTQEDNVYVQMTDTNRSSKGTSLRSVLQKVEFVHLSCFYILDTNISRCKT